MPATSTRSARRTHEGDLLLRRHWSARSTTCSPSPAANAAITGADVWNINSVESVALEYSRYNYNVTDFYEAGPYRSSDHDPIVVGLGLKAAPVTLNLLNINDFHGRIDSNTVKFAGTVEKLRAEGGEGNTLFLSAGDNIGASLFASASAGDIPTLDVLNALDLKTSAVGNHEFDKGLTRPHRPGRRMRPTSATWARTSTRRAPRRRRCRSTPCSPWTV